MFSTHSAVSQLKPDTVVHGVQGAEEALYAQGEFFGSSSASSGGSGSSAAFGGGGKGGGTWAQPPADGADLGSVLLGCGFCVPEIHAHFNLLESRTCRVNLGVRRSQNSIRPVPKSRQPDDGSAKTSRTPAEVLYLDSRDLRVFNHAYLCAVYPVLAAPLPPSPASPPPGPNYNLASRRGSHQAPDIHPVQMDNGRADASPLSPEPQATKLLHPRTLSPYAFHDSGVEESDEASLIGLIPMESICQLLQRAFGLTNTLFKQYEAAIVRAYSRAKKSSPKVLAEELTGQLAVLENNSHPFYAPGHFITRNGYDLWQKQERMHIAELLKKFWQYSLPLLRDHQDRIADLQGVHEDYQILLKKLLDHESQFREEADGTSALTFTPLSSASCRLLLEFGLRYGIGEMFRKTFLLQNLISEFSPAVGYVTYIHNLVLSIKGLLPSNKSAVVMVKQELDVLHSSLRVLKTQTCKALSQMKDLFSDSRPANGIGLLLGLLKSVMGLMAYLAPSNTQHESYKKCVQDTVLGIFRPHYGKIKAAVWADCDHGRGEQISPQMLNIIIVNIVSEVADFRNNFEGAFQKFFSITEMAALSFYHLLMEDVDAFCQISSNGKVTIDRKTLALAYRLNQLDSEWGSFILPRHQTWRTSFLPKLDEWIKALKLKSQQFIIKSVSLDQYMSQKIELPLPLATYQDPSMVSERNSCSISVVSITPSVNSAFSSIMSSIRSTPCHAPPRPQRQGTANPGAKMPSMFGKKIPTPNISKPIETGTDQETGLLLQEKEPVTFSPSSLDSKLLKSVKPDGDPGSHLSSQGFVSLPDKLNNSRSVPSKSAKDHYDKAASISAWTEEVAKHQPHVVISQAGSIEREFVHPMSNDAIASVSWESAKVSENDKGNVVARDKRTQPSLVIPPCRFTPISSDGEGGRGSASTVDHESFNFPPLSLESQPIGMAETVDFSQPVFQRPHSCQKEIGHPSTTLKTDTGASAEAGMPPPTTLDRQNLTSFDYFTSNSTITVTDTREALLSTSGSLIDVIVMLQRLCGFSSNLLGIFLSSDPYQFGKSRMNSVMKLRSKESFSESGEGESKPGKPSATTEPASSGVVDPQSSANPSSFSIFKSWSTFTTSFSTTRFHLSSNKDDSGSFKTNSFQSAVGMDVKPQQIDPHDLVHTELHRDPRHAVVRTPSRIGLVLHNPVQEQDSPAKSFSKLKTRLKLHLHILGTLCDILTVYSTNVLCMDLCGTPKAVAKKLIGVNLVNLVRKQQEDGAVWGCRHQGEVPYGCLYYFNRRVDYLCERYEPVTQHMCTRVNNAFACLYLLEEYCERLNHVFSLDMEQNGRDDEDDEVVERRAGNDLESREVLLASGRSDGAPSGTSSSGTHSHHDGISSSSGYLTSEAAFGLDQKVGGNTPQRLDPSQQKLDDSSVSSEDDSLSDVAGSVPTLSLKQRWRTRAQQTYSAARHHLLATITSMCRLQAYKLNLFVRDGLPMLLRLKDPKVTMDSCLSPIITFMQRYLDSLSGWLFRDCFRRVLDYLWVLIVQDIEFHANRLLSAESSASHQAHDWMMAIGVLIKFMNNSGRGIKKELLLSQANDVIFRLQLFTLSTKRLIILYQKLKEYHTEVDELTLEENASRSPPAILHRIHSELQSLRKCFSGAELVRWIIKNRSVLPADLSVADDDITKDIAIEIAQDLLDNHFIIELESALQTKSNTPTSALGHFSPYPQLSVHSYGVSETEESWEEIEGQHQRRLICDPSRGIGSASSSDDHTEAILETQQFDVHHTFPPLTGRPSPESLTPTGTVSRPSTRNQTISGACSPLSGPRELQGPSPLGLGSRYNPSPASSTEVSSKRDCLSPGPMHHSKTGDRSSAEPEEASSQTGTNYAATSSNRTPTPSGHQFQSDVIRGSNLQVAQAQPGGLTQEHSTQPRLDEDDFLVREAGFLGSLGSRASVADFRPSAARPQPHSPRGDFGRLRKDSDVLSIDSAELFGRGDFGNGVSPFSSIAELAFFNSRKFVAGSKHFYFIHQSVLNPSLSLFRQRQLRDELNFQRGNQKQGQRSQHAPHEDRQDPRKHDQNEKHLFDSKQLRRMSRGRLSAPASSNMISSYPGATVATLTEARANLYAEVNQTRREERHNNDDRIDGQHKNAMENLALVEQCISHKISPNHIAAIIMGRQKTDKLAKQFCK